MKKLILASTSPRRRKIMKEFGLDFDIVSPSYDENLVNKTFSYEKIENIAKNKCESAAVKADIPSIIISADTVVIYNNTVMGKPKDYNEAFNMLTLLNGKTHNVVTAICIRNTDNNKEIIKSETSEVTFNYVSDESIKNYINEFKPYDKAGSYGIQELPEGFIKDIKGDFNNIVGLPINTLIEMIEQITNN